MLKRVLLSFVTVVALLLGSLGFVAVTATSASADTASFAVGKVYPSGPGHDGPVYAGIWALDGKRGPCIDFNLVTPDSVAGTQVVTQVPGMSAEDSKRAFVLVQKYRSTRSDTTAAALAFAIWKLRGDKAFKTWYRWARKNGHVPSALNGRVNRMLRESTTHGPYKLSVALEPVLKGQKGTGTVGVVDSAGLPAKGIRVKVNRLTRAAKVLKTSVTTDANGSFTFRFERIKESKVGFKASVTEPAVDKALLSRPSAGRQRLLVGGFNDTASATAEYNSAAGKPTITTVCSTNCDGTGVLTVSFDNRGSTSKIRWMVKDGSTLILQLDVKPGETGAATAAVTDGMVLTIRSCVVKKGECTSKPVKEKKKYEVVCPAWPQADINLACTCHPDASGNVTFYGLLPGNPRFYTGYVTINNGVVVRPAPLVNGQATVVDIGQIPPGTKIDVTFKAWRDAGKTDLLLEGKLQSIIVN